MANTPSTLWPLNAGYPSAISLALSGKFGELVMRTQCSVSPSTARSAVRPKLLTERCPASMVNSAQLPMNPPRPRDSAGVVKAMKYTRLPLAPSIVGRPLHGDRHPVAFDLLIVDLVTQRRQPRANRRDQPGAVD